MLPHRITVMHVTFPEASLVDPELQRALISEDALSNIPSSWTSQGYGPSVQGRFWTEYCTAMTELLNDCCQHFHWLHKSSNALTGVSSLSWHKSICWLIWTEMRSLVIGQVCTKQIPRAAGRRVNDGVGQSDRLHWGMLWMINRRAPFSVREREKRGCISLTVKASWYASLIGKMPAGNG